LKHNDHNEHGEGGGKTVRLLFVVIVVGVVVQGFWGGAAPLSLYPSPLVGEREE
jgi:hypothetical protein